jgi:hypothetical protein
MNLESLTEWVPVSQVPNLTSGRITLTHAKRLFRDRNSNGFAASGAARIVGRHGLVHVPTLLDLVFGQEAQP